MKTKAFVTKVMLVNISPTPLIFCAAVGVMAWATQMSISTWLSIMVVGAVVMTALVSSALPRGLVKTFAAAAPTVRYTEDPEVNAESRSLLRRLMVLSSVTAILSMASFVLLIKYHKIAAGVISASVAVIPAIWITKTTRRLRELSRSRKKLVTATEPGFQKVEHKMRFYLFFILLTAYSMLAGFLFWACLYLVVFGEKTAVIVGLLFVSIVGLSLVPNFSGLVVRKLELSEEVES